MVQIIKLIIKLCIVSVNVLLIDTIQRHNPISEYKHDYELRLSKPITTKDYDRL